MAAGGTSPSAATDVGAVDALLQLLGQLGPEAAPPSSRRSPRSARCSAKLTEERDRARWGEQLCDACVQAAAGRKRAERAAAEAAAAEAAAKSSPWWRRP